MLNKAKLPHGVNAPDNFVCNASMNHKTTKCYCVSCLPIKEDVYYIGDPIQVSASFPMDKKDYCGIYLRDNSTQKQKP